MSEKRFVSVSELPSAAEFDPAVHCISWDTQLPPTVDVGRIVLDTQVLKAVHEGAGFVSSRVVGTKRPDNRMSMGALDANLRSIAVVGFETFHGEAAEQLGQTLMTNYFANLAERQRLTHYLDRGEMAPFVVEKVKEGVPREKAWAQVLNSTLVASMRDAVDLRRQNALYDRTNIAKLLIAARVSSLRSTLASADGEISLSVLDIPYPEISVGFGKKAIAAALTSMRPLIRYRK